MVWLILLKIRTKPERGFGTRELHSAPRGFRPKVFSTCLPVSRLSRALKERGLGEPLGKASLANTAHRLGTLISMRNRSFRAGPAPHGVQGWRGMVRHPSKVGPDEGLRRGLPRPLAKEKEN